MLMIVIYTRSDDEDGGAFMKIVRMKSTFKAKSEKIYISELNMREPQECKTARHPPRQMYWYRR